MPKLYNLDPEIKAKWITALTDGSFKQCRGSMAAEIGTNDDGSKIIGYCCLGVLCAITGKDMFIPPDRRTINRDEDYSHAAKIIGCELDFRTRHSCLPELNDGYAVRNTPQHSFAEIAKIIEEEF